MTLPELMIVMVMLGILATVVAAAISVVYRTEPSATGRLNVARAEQNVALFMPADLSSATGSNNDPGASPCGAPSCPGVGALGGSNAIMVTWPENGGTKAVAYIFRPIAGVDGRYDLVRVECLNNANCSSVTVLHDLEGPTHDTFVPGVSPVPSTAIDVTVPLAPGADEVSASNYDSSSNANRIVVTINGGGSSEGAGGGVNKISITAGGTHLDTVVADTVTGPSFLQARSNCGGPVTVIVDESSSVGGDITKVRQAVKGFVEALAGTPTRVQVVRFDLMAGVLGLPAYDNSGDIAKWNKYYDMSDEAQVTALVGLADSLRSDWPTASGNNYRGGTNWEDALFRTFYTPAGVPINQDGDPATELPELVVFFTDGVPTYDRGWNYSELNNETIPGARTGALPAEPVSPQQATPPTSAKPWPVSNGGIFSQVAWNRADWIVDQFRDSTKIIGVGVGPGLAENSYTFDNPRDGIRYRRVWTGSVWDRRTEERYWSSGSWRYRLLTPQTSNKKLLGDLIAGGVPQAAGTSWVESTWNGTSWSNRDSANLYATTNWSALPSALASIAIGECGGTLTMQTRLSNGSAAPADVTYELGGTTVVTSLVSRAAAFDIESPGGTAVDVVVRPQGLEQAGYTATGWSCKLKGLPLEPTRYSQVSANPADGIRVNVAPNEAISCVMVVS